MFEDDLSVEERERLQGLPRERQPSELLEERVVRALAARGRLRMRVRPRRAWSPAWIGAAAAAAVALYAAGFASGQWIESRQNARTLVALHERDAAQAAALLQQTGSAYLAALAQMADVADSSRAREIDEGREVAVNIMHTAANHLMRLVPDEPVAAGILRGLDRADAPDSSMVAMADNRRVIWF